MKTQRNEQESAIVSIAKGGGFAFAGRLFSLGLSYVLVILLARGLGTEQYGIYAVGFSLVTLLGSLALFGLNRGTVRFIAMHYGEGDGARALGAFQAAIRFICLSSLVVGGLVILLARPLAHLLNIPSDYTQTLWLLACWIFVWAGLYELTAVIEAIKRLEYRTLIFDIGWPLARLVLTFLVLAGGGQIYAVITANIVATGLTMIMMAITVYRLFYDPLRHVTAVSPLRPLLEFSLPVMLFNIVILSQSQIEVYLLTVLQSVEASGIFSAAARTSILIVAFLEGLGVIFSPFVADLSHRGRMADLQALATTVTRWSFMIGLPAAILIILFREPLLLLFGTDFVLAAPALVILALGQLINAATGPVGIILTMSGQPRVNLANSILTLVLSVVLGMALIPHYGIVGAALGSSFSTSIVNVFRLVLVYKLLRIWAYNRQFVKPVIAALIAMGITYTAVLRTHHHQANWWYSLIGILIFLVSYGVCILLLKLDESDLMVMRMARSRLTNSTQRAPEV